MARSGARPIAIIQRWLVVTDEDGNMATWPVVTAVKGSCPNANAIAIAGDFDCEFDVATVSSTVRGPGVAFICCRERWQE